MSSGDPIVDKIIRDMFEALAADIRQAWGASPTAKIIVDDDGNVIDVVDDEATVH